MRVCVLGLVFLAGCSWDPARTGDPQGLETTVAAGNSGAAEAGTAGAAEEPVDAGEGGAADEPVGGSGGRPGAGTAGRVDSSSAGHGWVSVGGAEGVAGAGAAGAAKGGSGSGGATAGTGGAHSLGGAGGSSGAAAGGAPPCGVPDSCEETNLGCESCAIFECAGYVKKNSVCSLVSFYATSTGERDEYKTGDVAARAASQKIIKQACYTEQPSHPIYCK